MDVNRIYSAEQIAVPPELPQILKDWTKAVIRANPTNVVVFSAQWFQEKVEEEGLRLENDKLMAKMREKLKRYDNEGQGRMKVDDLGAFLSNEMQLEGYDEGNPSELLADLVLDLDPETSGWIQLENLLQWYHEHLYER